MMPKRIELVFFEGCPNVDAARGELRRALVACGLEPSWQEWDTTRDEVPDRVKGYCSPTVLVNGQDVMGQSQGSGFGCCVGGSPPASAIITALKAGAA